MILAQRIVARREAMGLPAPSVEQVQRMIHRRQMMRRWQRATPEQRQAFAESHPRAAAMIEAREARRDATPEQREAWFDAHPQARARMEARRALRDATPEQREAFLAAHPRARAMMEQRRARREGLTPAPTPTPEPN
jgi:ABC-type transporter MlaC component